MVIHDPLIGEMLDSVLDFALGGDDSGRKNLQLVHIDASKITFIVVLVIVEID
jgi:hypothetical protein